MTRELPGRARRVLVTETWLVLAVSLGASAIWSLLRIVERMTRNVPLNRQTTTMNSSVTPDRPWLDLAWQLTGVVLGVMPAALAIFLLATRFRPEGGVERALGWRPRWVDLATGFGLTAAIGIPGLGLYLAARHLGVNTDVAAANLGQQWWTVPVLALAAAMNGVLEEVVMVGYLLTRWLQARWATWTAIAVSALVRGSYHLYQGFGGFVGNLVMGLVFGWIFVKWRRVWPLVICHTLLDVFAFVGYALLKGHVSWL